MNEDYNLRYPIGTFSAPDFINENHINLWRNTIEELPTILHGLIDNLSQEQWDWKYRDHGWTIAQVIGHMCDSHTNAFIRFKLALTEDTPTIKPYKEGLWAELGDYDKKHIFHAMNMLESVHYRWMVLLKNMDVHTFHNRSYFHPDSHKNFTLGEGLGLYDWHCKHHTEHIKNALKFENKF